MPTIITESTLFSACEKESLHQLAMGFLEVIRHQGLVPKVIIDSALITAYRSGACSSRPVRSSQHRGSRA